MCSTVVLLGICCAFDAERVPDKTTDCFVWYLLCICVSVCVHGCFVGYLLPNKTTVNTRAVQMFNCCLTKQMVHTRLHLCTACVFKTFVLLGHTVVLQM